MGEALLEFGDYQKGGFVQTLAEDVSEQETSDESETDTSEVTISADVTESKMSAIKEAIITQQQGKIADLVQEAVDAGIAAEEIINDVMISAMDEVGRKFTASEIFVPEMLLSANTMKEGVNLLQPLLQGDAVQSRGKIMIATVKGDLHDIGKNIVSLMLEGGGFEVVDLGINIDEEEILRQVKKHKPDVLALSALLTTTMNEMRTVIQSLHEAGLKDDTPVMVGGAPVSQEFADQIGADGYSQDAAGAVELAKSFTAIQQ
jgi:corrinoid protein of di/trimethylamine methyltransferase